MNSTTSSTKYTAMYNTFKTYSHGKNLDNIYDKESYQEKAKSQTEQDFNPNVAESKDSYYKTDLNIGSNILFNSSDSNNNINNSNKYELNRNGPIPKITEDDRESEGTFFNEEPKYYDEYDEQYVIINYFILFIYILFFREI
jgi:hypothetical protein